MVPCFCFSAPAVREVSSDSSGHCRATCRPARNPAKGPAPAAASLGTQPSDSDATDDSAWLKPASVTRREAAKAELDVVGQQPPVTSSHPHNTNHSTAKAAAAMSSATATWQDDSVSSTNVGPSQLFSSSQQSHTHSGGSVAMHVTAPTPPSGSTIRTGSARLPVSPSSSPASSSASSRPCVFAAAAQLSAIQAASGSGAISRRMTGSQTNILKPSTSFGSLHSSSMAANKVETGSSSNIRRLFGKLAGAQSEPAATLMRSLPSMPSMRVMSGPPNLQRTASTHSVPGVAAWSRSPSGGNLLGASVNRLACHVVHTSDGVPGSAKASLESPVSAAKADAAAPARQFAEHFIKALLGGHAAWGSWPEVGAVLAQDCEMITHDEQVHTGRTAVIRRLNKGMEQFLKLMGVGPDANEAAAAELAAKAGKVEAYMDVAVLSPQSSRKGGRAMPVVNGSGSVVVVITYTFKAGIRRFKLQDRFKLRQGLIVRLRRYRL